MTRTDNKPCFAIEMPRDALIAHAVRSTAWGPACPRPLCPVYCAPYGRIRACELQVGRKTSALVTRRRFILGNYRRPCAERTEHCLDARGRSEPILLGLALLPHHPLGLSARCEPPLRDGDRERARVHGHRPAVRLGVQDDRPLAADAISVPRRVDTGLLRAAGMVRLVTDWPRQPAPAATRRRDAAVRIGASDALSSVGALYAVRAVDGVGRAVPVPWSAPPRARAGLASACVHGRAHSFLLDGDGHRSVAHGLAASCLVRRPEACGFRAIAGCSRAAMAGLLASGVLHPG